MNKKMRYTFSAFIIAGLCVLTVTAQKPANENTTGLLYKISGKGLAKSSYIFGTFHVLCPTDMMPMSKLDPYIDQAEQFVMEIDMDDPAEMQSMKSAAML